MPVVILCGGQGTRLREETEYRPKPMVEIGPQPILWHIMKIYGVHGLDRFVLCLGYKGWEIKQYFLRYQEMHSDFTLAMDGSRPLEIHDGNGVEPWRVTCAETGADTATGARLWHVRRYLEGAPTFCLTYGDAVSDVDIGAVLAFHRAQGRLATVTGVHPTSRYGELAVDGTRVREFAEKPVAEGLVSGGFFVFQREALERYFDDDPQLFLEQRPLRGLASDGELSVYVHEGFWHPMDTYRDYLHLNALWRQEPPPWKVW
jgi:glucose-1-phosphate cytidylyltransferase